MAASHERIPRWIVVALATAVAITLVAFLHATHRSPPPAGYGSHRAASAAGEVLAPTNLALASGRESQNRSRQASALAALSASAQNTRAVPHDEAAWQAARERRAHARAYDGAPPVIPHPIDQRGMPNCVTCHERNLRIGDKVAPSPSHASYTSCTQCHVVTQAPLPVMATLSDEPKLDNGFAGLESAGKGTRAWPGAPPVIPHTSWMRERCASCHGSLHGLHSSHADRQSCTQCHAPSAELDQRDPRSAALRGRGPS